MHYWSIYPIRHELIEGSECSKLLTVGGSKGVPMPKPTRYNEKAYVFVDYLSDAAEPLIVQMTEDNTLEELAVQIETYLTDSDTRCVWLSKALASQLYKLLVLATEEI